MASNPDEKKDSWASDDDASELLSDVLEETERDAEEEERKIRETIKQKKQKEQQKKEAEKQKKREEAEARITAEMKKFSDLEEESEDEAEEVPPPQAQQPPASEAQSSEPKDRTGQNTEKSPSESESRAPWIWVAAGMFLTAAAGGAAVYIFSDQLFQRVDSKTYSKIVMAPVENESMSVRRGFIPIETPTQKEKKETRRRRARKAAQQKKSQDNKSPAQKPEQDKTEDQKESNPEINVGDIDSDPYSSDNF